MKEKDHFFTPTVLPPWETTQILASSNVRKQVRNKDHPAHLRAHACTSANVAHRATETHASESWAPPARTFTSRRSPTRLPTCNKNERRRWATNYSFISQVASFKFKERRKGQTPRGLLDRFYIIASFGILRLHHLEASAPIQEALS